jgi:hypothetical protein
MNDLVKTSIVVTAIGFAMVPTTVLGEPWMPDVPYESHVSTPNYVVDSVMPAATGVAPTDWHGRF